MSEAFNWAFIGAGTLGKQVIREITASGRHRIAAVYTRNPETCREVASSCGAVAASSAEEAISCPGVDGVYIVTPHTTHYEYTLQALNLGKPVLCEKPVTTDAKKAEEMICLSREKHLYFAEAMWTWFSPIANQVKAWLDAGEYGSLRRVHLNHRCMAVNYAPRVTDPMVAGGALLDTAVYPLTYLYRLFGMPEKIECTGELSGGIDLGEEIRLTWPNGRVCTASVSIKDENGTEYLLLEGDKARTELPGFHYANSVTLQRVKGESETFSAYGGMLNEFDLAASEIRDGLTESRFVPHRATLDVMRIMDECRRQLGLVYHSADDLPRQ